MKTLHSRICLLLTAAVLGLSGCGGESPAVGPTNPAPSATTGNTISIDVPMAVAPVIDEHPADLGVFEGQTARFDVKVRGTDTVTYQWRRNGVDIAGAKSSAYVVDATVPKDSGDSFTVAVKGVGGTTVSANAKLTVWSKKPQIVTPPSVTSVEAGKNAVFSVTVTGLPPLRYQWSKNGVPITDAKEAVYQTPVSMSDNGAIFSVTVTNGEGTVKSSDAKLSVTTPTLKNLVISEVSSCDVQTGAPVSCWFEVYNPTGAEIDLSKYAYKSTGWNLDTNTLVNETTFTLSESFPIPSGGYVIMSGNPGNSVQTGSQNALLRFGSVVPYWTQNGFVEILSIAVTDDRRSTVDFVVFGSSVQKPKTDDQWRDAPVAALPFGQDQLGKSIVRLYPRTADTDTNAADDWAQVAWATPAGRNDVPADAVDDDNDGIPDSSEVLGSTFSGIDLYALGARKGPRDLFVEVDYMNPVVEDTDPDTGEITTYTDYGVIPRVEALQKVATAFAAHDIKVWFDLGKAHSPILSVQNFNLGQSTYKVDAERCVTFDQVTCLKNKSTLRSVYDWKNKFMDLNRRPIFHYLLFGFSQINGGGGSGSPGQAEILGNDMIVTLGLNKHGIDTAAQLNLLVNLQAASIMHELGHNLGLRHGGNEDLDRKPNYLSVMNSLYHLNGLDPDPASQTAYERWVLEVKGGGGIVTRNSLVGSPEKAQSNFKIDFSDGSGLVDLDENALFESNNIGHGNAGGNTWADWDLLGGRIPTPDKLQIDLNEDKKYTILRDHDDWSNLEFPFVRKATSNTGVNPFGSKARVLSPLNNDKQSVATHGARISKASTTPGPLPSR